MNRTACSFFWLSSSSSSFVPSGPWEPRVSPSAPLIYYISVALMGLHYKFQNPNCPSVLRSQQGCCVVLSSLCWEISAPWWEGLIRKGSGWHNLDILIIWLCVKTQGFVMYSERALRPKVDFLGRNWVHPRDGAVQSPASSASGWIHLQFT